MRIFKYLNKFQNASSLAFVFASGFILVGEIARLSSLFLTGEIQSVLYDFSRLFSALLPYAFCYFITLSLTNSSRSYKAFWSILCLALFSTAYSSLSDNGHIYFFGIIVSLLCVLLFNSFDKAVAASVSMLLSVLLGLLFGYIGEMWINFTMMLAQLISNRGVFSSLLFSLLNSILTLFDIDTLSDMFFYKSYGGTILIDENIVTGVKDLFDYGYSGSLISYYLSGHYFMLFSFSGMAWSLLGELREGEKTALLITAVCAVLSGNVSLLMLFFLIESPFLFLSAAAVSVLGYIASSILDLGTGYICSGGIIEMLFNLNKPVYLFAGGAVFVAIGYFVFKYSIEKHGISACHNIYIPSRLNSLVRNLGGIENIIRYKDNAVEVRNPELVNTLSIDVEINENVIKSEDEKFCELGEYLKE